ncbi:MAG: winged helix-turn-helix domain-containing protein, partial [Gammaproteobacteria bacterium]|nr:winged helix-turn-helix domain-containing protein [Gammaproteobacteria bacterium]
PNMLSQDELIEKVWGPGRIISPENLSQRVAMLRQSLGDASGDPKYVETVYGQGFRLVPDVKTVDSHDDPNESTRAVRNSRAGGRVAAALLMFGLMAWGVFKFSPIAPESSADPITIAVLPFVNLSADVAQDYFVEGLTEEVLNSLVTVDGLLVTGRTSSFAYKNRNMDLRQIGDELDVDYLLEGSVRRSGDQIRVTAQLIDAANGGHIRSDTYDRGLADAFAVQYEVSRQVAAALKVSLIHRDDQYDGALDKLDSIAVEQLLTARAKIGVYSAVPVRQALDTLEQLDSRYPDTPEVIGLIARGHMIHGSVGAVAESEEINYVDIALRALELDPTNLDALITVAVTADDFAEHRIKAKKFYQEMIQYHPGRKENYARMLSYLQMTYAPCDEIAAFLEGVPSGAISSEPVEEYDACLIQPWTSGFTDENYNDIANLVDENPNQRYLASLYMQQLRLGAMAAARETDLLLDYEVGGWWVSFAAGYKGVYGQPADRPLDRYIDYFVRINYGSYDRSALFLLHQASQGGNVDQLVEYLDALPEFPIEIPNQYSVVGLMALQHRAGRIEDSQRTGRLYSEAASRYLAQSPASYHHYHLARNHLIAAVYAGEFDAVEEILRTGVADNHPYWRDDIGVIQTFLAPWLELGVVSEYMKRVEEDRHRARNALGLN